MRVVSKRREKGRAVYRSDTDSVIAAAFRSDGSSPLPAVNSPRFRHDLSSEAGRSRDADKNAQTCAVNGEERQ